MHVCAYCVSVQCSRPISGLHKHSGKIPVESVLAELSYSHHSSHAFYVPVFNCSVLLSIIYTHIYIVCCLLGAFFLPLHTCSGLSSAFCARQLLESIVKIGTVCTTVRPLGSLMVPQRSSCSRVCMHEPVFYTAQ